MALSVLSRKCGSRWARSRATSASLRSRAASRTRVRALSTANGYDEGERPQAEVQLRAQHPEQGGAHETDAVGVVDAQRRHVHRDPAVGQAVHAAHRRGDGDPDGQALRRGEVADERAAERHREREHEQRQLGAHVDEAGHQPGALFPRHRVVGELQSHDAQHRHHADDKPRAERPGNRGRRRRGGRRPPRLGLRGGGAPAGGRQRQAGRCSHLVFIVQRRRTARASAGRKSGRPRPRNRTARHLH